MSCKLNISPKSNKVAEIHRHKALQEAKNGRFLESLLLLNKSLCHAEPASSTIAHIFTSRAEIFYQLKLFDKSLNNISLARECQHAKDILDVADVLEEKCHENISNQIKPDDPWDFFKLSYPANKQIPFIIDCLQVQNDKKYGRYITTTYPLNAGDILAIEEPFFKFLKVDMDDTEYPVTNQYNYCVNCLQDNYLDLIPCDECTTTMFCSRDCMDEANRVFHEFECNVQDILKETDNFRMAIRNFFVSLAICDENIEELKDLMAQCDDTNLTVFNFDFKAGGNNAKNLLMSMISLTNKTDVKISDVSCVFQHHKFLKNLWTNEKEFINRYLERMLQVEILNFHGIKGRSLSRRASYRRCVGDGSYAFCSLLNHSCCPNVMRIVVDNRMVLIVERPIKAGEQLFDCYIGDSFYFKPKPSRHVELEDYNFACECQACENEFPELTSGLLSSNDVTLFRMAQTAYKELQDPRKVLTVNEAKQLSKKYSNVLNQNYCEKKYPCKEIVMLQLCIVKCFLTAAFSTITFP